VIRSWKLKNISIIGGSVRRSQKKRGSSRNIHSAYFAWLT
jgi:hypothetical protein